ncbi:MAG TPA: hypothetical protein PL108_03700 [Sediminibacterium sp.]|nr:hypothetical protein [Sediminibacterium sp.]
MKGKKWMLTVLMIFNGIFSNAQSTNYTKLHDFLLNNFDSTIIFYSYNNWQYYSNYLIASKVNNEVYFFTYVNPYRNPTVASRPKILNNLFYQEEMKFRRTPADTNQYFLPFYINHFKKDSIWKQINSFNIWETKIDYSFKENPNKPIVHDGDEFEIHLITKEGIKRKYWYEPDMDERYSPGNSYRISGIKTRNALIEIFRHRF